MAKASWPQLKCLRLCGLHRPVRWKTLSTAQWQSKGMQFWFIWGLNKQDIEALSKATWFKCLGSLYVETELKDEEMLALAKVDMPCLKEICFKYYGRNVSNSVKLLSSFPALERIDMRGRFILHEKEFWKALAACSCCQNLKQLITTEHVNILNNIRPWGAPSNAVVMCLADGNFKSLERFSVKLRKTFSASEWLEVGKALYGKCPKLQSLLLSWEGGEGDEFAAINKSLLPLLRGEPMSTVALDATSRFRKLANF